MSTLLLTVLGLRGCWPVNVDPLNEKKESLDKLSSELHKMSSLNSYNGVRHDKIDNKKVIGPKALT